MSPDSSQYPWRIKLFWVENHWVKEINICVTHRLVSLLRVSPAPGTPLIFSVRYWCQGGFRRGYKNQRCCVKDIPLQIWEGKVPVNKYHASLCPHQLYMNTLYPKCALTLFKMAPHCCFNLHTVCLLMMLRFCLCFIFHLLQIYSTFWGVHFL